MTPAAARAGVSVVMPVHDGERWLADALAAVLAQADGRPLEVLAVEDGSRDRSSAILREFAAAGPVRILAGAGRGAAAAINLGVRHAAHPLIAQVDQDVIVAPGWLSSLTDALETHDAAAASGYYVTPAGGSRWARVMGLDLEQRYGRIGAREVDHVCTGNSVYRAAALRAVGLFDERLGYGYDNDMSYRLRAAGHRLVFCPEARSIHRWREDLAGYLAQQYGVGYGRLDLVAKHPRRIGGDDVSGPGMILHAVATTLAVGALGGAGAAALAGAAVGPWAFPALALLAGLGLERAVAGARAAWRFGDPAGLAFGPAHLLRDLAWVCALAVWGARRLAGRPPRPGHSMRRAGPRT